VMTPSSFQRLSRSTIVIGQDCSRTSR